MDYVSTLDNNYQKSQKAEYFQNFNKVQVHGVLINIVRSKDQSLSTWAGFVPPMSTPNFCQKLVDTLNQHIWLAYVLLDGQPELLVNIYSKIYKLTLTFEPIFSWSLVHFCLMPTRGDNTLVEKVLLFW